MKTITIRIPCLVDSQGNWYACNWLNRKRTELRDDKAARTLLHHHDFKAEEPTLVWITAEVPLPEQSSIEVEGTVEA